MHTHETEERLEAKGIRPTANRILVLKALGEAGHPMSLTDLETQIESMDKSSVFRTLTLFLEKDLVHSFEDGRGIINYELCTEEGHCDHHDAHIISIVSDATAPTAWNTSTSTGCRCRKALNRTPTHLSSRESVPAANSFSVLHRPYDIVERHFLRLDEVFGARKMRP